MSIQKIFVDFSVNWIRLTNDKGQPYKWCDKISKDNKDWETKNIIYRWVKNSTQCVAYVGEAGRSLSGRLGNYKGAKPEGRAGVTNKKVYNEAENLKKIGDFLYLEFTVAVCGFNLNDDRDRIFAESFLIGHTKPYLQGEVKKKAR